MDDVIWSLTPCIELKKNNRQTFLVYVFVHLVCSSPLGNRLYCLPEHYAMVVTDEDMKTVNSGPIPHVLVLRSRMDMPGVFDLIVV